MLEKKALTASPGSGTIWRWETRKVTRRIWQPVICLVTLLLISGCSPVSPEEYSTLINENNTIKAELSREQAAAGELREQLEAEKARAQAVQEENQRQILTLAENLTSLQAEYERRLESITTSLNKSELRNPTWLELKGFLEIDGTDSLAYQEDRFDCTGFAITLRDNAWRYGWRCAYVEVNYVDATTGHALNAFQTSDYGLIYVDATNDDTIAYVKTGEPYGTVYLDGVKEKFISCQGKPDDFWAPLRWDTTPHLFTYDYYSEYQRRIDFYHDTIDAYNEAVSDYNRGGTKYSSSQLDKWLENIDALEKDLGTQAFMPGEIVKTIEAYWN